MLYSPQLSDDGLLGEEQLTREEVFSVTSKGGPLEGLSEKDALATFVPETVSYRVTKIQKGDNLVYICYEVTIPYTYQVITAY